MLNVTTDGQSVAEPLAPTAADVRAPQVVSVIPVTPPRPMLAHSPLSLYPDSNPQAEPLKQMSSIQLASSTMATAPPIVLSSSYRKTETLNDTVPTRWDGQRGAPTKAAKGPDSRRNGRS
jgi:hypothetical protein